MTDAPLQIHRRGAIGITLGAALAPIAGPALAQSSAIPVLSDGPLRQGRDEPFNDGWRFAKGDIPGAERPDLDDRAWRQVSLPHDWSIEDIPGGATGPFSKEAEDGTATGFTLGGEGWYRKRFGLDGLPAGARVEVAFDGVHLESDIWLNGIKLGSNIHGYMPFAIELTEHLRRDTENVLAVHVRNSEQNSRWYTGSGIYREVRIDVTLPGCRLARWGVRGWTRRIEGAVAEIDVSTVIEGVDPALEIVTRLRDANGKVAAEAVSHVADMVKQTLTLRAPRLWSIESPDLYALETELRRGKVVVDRIDQAFGVRIVSFHPQLGMAINGARVVLRGGCIHHDNGLLGACAFRDADERRVRLLKARGYNAIRSAHNIVSRSLREACDRLGMLLIDEAFDTWHVSKKPKDFSIHFREHWHEVIKAMVLSGRNSPSVVMWSIGNEIPQRATDEGVEWEWKLANAIKRLDPTRPVTAGLNGMLGAPMVASEATARPGSAARKDNASTIFLDVLGYNYRLGDVEYEHAEFPDRVIYGSETFPKDAWDYARLVERRPNFLGEFLWTAMDYLGEAGLGAATNISVGGVAYNLPTWPWVNAWCGDIDLVGNAKAPSRYRDVVWGLSPLEIAVQRPVPEGQVESTSNWGWSDELRSWNWQGAEGKELAVRLYTSGDRVELRLNGVKVGEKSLASADKMRTEIKVRFAPGVLEAVAFRGAREIARKRIDTVGAPAQLRLRSERTTARRDRQGLSYVAVEVLDAQGRLVPDEKRRVSLAIDGAADLIAFGSANPHAVGSFQKPYAETFHGRAMAILRSQGKMGHVRIMATSPGLKPSATTIKLV